MQKTTPITRQQPLGPMPSFSWNRTCDVLIHIVRPVFLLGLILSGLVLLLLASLAQAGELQFGSGGAAVEVPLPSWVVKERGTFLIVVNSELQPKVQAALDTYKQDLLKQGFKNVIQKNWEYKEYNLSKSASHPDAPLLKEYLLKVYRRDSTVIDPNAPQLEGALFVGKLPFVLTRIEADPWTSGIYFMGLKSGWTDKTFNKVYAFDEIEDAPLELDIYVGILDAHKIEIIDTNGDGIKDDEATMINHYFMKNHRYRVGGYRPQGQFPVDSKGLAVDMLNYKNEYGPPISGFRAYQNYRKLDLSAESPAAPTPQEVINHLSGGNGYEMFEISAHGATEAVALKGGYPNGYLFSSHFASNEYALKNLFFEFSDCNVGRYNIKDYMVGTFLFRKDYGLAGTWAIPNNNQETFYFDALGGGETIGEAFKKSWNKAIAEASIVGHSTFSTIFGDPTLWISERNPERLMPNVKLDMYIVDDKVGGNGNGVLEAGEEAKITVQLSNAGGQVLNVQGVSLKTDNLEAMVIKGQVNFGDIERFGKATNNNDPFIIKTTANWDSDARFEFSIQAASQDDTSQTYKKDFSFTVEVGFRVAWLARFEEKRIFNMAAVDVTGDGTEEIVLFYNNDKPEDDEIRVYELAQDRLNLLAKSPVTGSEFTAGSEFAVGRISSDQNISANIVTKGVMYSWDISSRQLLKSSLSETASVYDYQVGIGSFLTPNGKRAGYVELADVYPEIALSFNTIEDLQKKEIWNYTQNAILPGVGITPHVMAIGNLDDDAEKLDEVVVAMVTSDGQDVDGYVLALDSSGHKIWERQDKIKGSQHNYTNLVLANILGDSKLECLVRFGYSYFILDYQGNKLAEFQEKLMSVQEVPLVMDINGDGIKEVIFFSAASPEFLVYRFQNGPDGWQVLKERIPAPGDFGDRQIFAGDLLGDDETEITTFGSNNRFHINGTKGNSLYANDLAAESSDGYFGRQIICDCDGDKKVEIVLFTDDGSMYALHFNKTYDSRNMIYPMAYHDPQRTRAYKDPPMPPQWVMPPPDKLFWAQEPDSLEMKVSSKSGTQSGLQFTFEGLPAGIQKEETVTPEGKTVTLKWTPAVEDAQQYGVNVQVTDETGLMISRRFYLDVVHLPFIRGDANMSGAVDISDGINILSFLFSGLSESPVRLAALDSNDNGEIDISDAVYLLKYLFSAGPAPAAPFPAAGVDPTRPNKF